jgi:hypothetical protein
MNKYPIFVFGSGRSGTTLLQTILNSYKDICISGEHGGFLKGIAESYFSFHKANIKNKILQEEKN